MTQKTFFDTAPAPVNHYGYARKSDPPASHAVSEIKLNERQQQFVNALKTMQIPATAQEVAAAAVPIDGTMELGAAMSLRDSIRKRAKELVTQHVIRECGARTCRTTGHEAQTYQISSNVGSS